MKLQANESGAWRNVATIDPERLVDVLHTLPALARAIGPGVKWCIQYDDGKRDWLGTLSEAVASTGTE